MKKSSKKKPSKNFKPRTQKSLSRKSKKTLEEEFYRLSGTAQSRMRELQKWVKKEPQYKNVLDWGYRLGRKAIARMYGENAKSFRRKAPTDKNTLIKNISEIEKFLSLPTTTKTGVIDIYKKRADTLNKNWGTNFSWEDLAVFFEGTGYEQNERVYGSDVYLLAIGEIQKNEEDIIKAIKQKRDTNLNIKDEAVKEAVDNLINEYGIKVVDLY